MSVCHDMIIAQYFEREGSFTRWHYRAFFFKRQES